MSGAISIWPQLPGFSSAAAAPPAPPPQPAPDADIGPKLNEGTRAKLTDSLYDEFYAKAMSREDFDKKAGGMSDKQIADAAYQSFYDGKIDRAKFNETVGLKSAEGSTARAITSGMMLGFQDEALAGAGTLMRTIGSMASGQMPTPGGMSAAYDQELRGQRDNADVFRQNNPYVGRGLEFAGGVLAGHGVPAGAPAGNIIMAGTPSRLQTAMTAGGVGALTGFGDAEGGFMNRATGAGIGAGVGAGIGAAAPFAVQGASMVLGKVGKLLGLGDSEKVATQLLLKAFQDDGIPPKEIATRLSAWQQAGAKPETLFDIGGQNVRRLARTSAGRTGPGTEKAVTFLEERQSDQARRVAEDVAKSLGQKASDFHPSMAALNETRKTSAAPLYEKAFAITPTADQAATVQRFIRDPIGQDALQKGMRVIELEHLADDLPFKPSMYGVTKGQDGRWVVAGDEVPNLRLMDAVKRGYDEIVEGFRDKTSGRLVLDQYGKAVNSVRATYTRRLRDTFPEYRGALDAWAGPSQLMDAANRGRSIFTMRDSEIASTAVAVRANPGEADAFRLGVAQAMRDKIAATPDGYDVVKRFFNNDKNRELIRVAFPDADTFDKFVVAMNREKAMFKKAQFVNPNTGSQTAPREADAADIGEMAKDVLGAMATGAIMPGQTTRGAVGQAFRNLGARSQGISPGVADSLAGRLFTSEPAAINRTAGLLSQTDVDNALARIQGRRVGGLLLPGLSAGVNVAR